MEYKGDEHPASDDARQLHSPEHTTVPASLLPSVLSRLGLGDIASLPKTGIDTALAALKDEEIPVKVAAVQSLGKRREASALESLVAALHDPAWEVRAAAVWALGEFGEQVSLEALMRAADDEDGSVRAAALRTLGPCGVRAPIVPLLRALDDPDWQVREIAALTLGEHGKQAPLAPLVARLNDAHASVREAVRMALEQSHPGALAVISINSIANPQESGADSALSMREQEQPAPGREVEAGVKIPSDSTLIRFTALVRTFLSRVLRDVVTPLGDARSSLADDMSSALAGEPGEVSTRQQSAQTRPRRIGRIAEGTLAAIIITGIVASWLVIEHRLRPSQGSASSPLLAYHGPMDGPALWSSDSKYVTMLTNSSPAGETVLVWNRATGQLATHLLRAPGAHPQENRTVFAPDGQHFAFVERVSNNRVAVQVWDAIAWRSVLLTYYSSPSGYLDVSWSPDSARLVISGEDGAMQVWSVATGRELVICHVPALAGLPSSVYMAPDGHHVIMGSGVQNTSVLDLTTCKLLTLPSSDSFFTYWSPQGNRFATISFTDASVVHVWDVQTGHNLANFHLAGSVSNIIWTPDGKRIIISSDKEVEVADVATWRSVLQVIPASTILQPVWALSADGTRIASLSGADSVQLWDAVTGHRLTAYETQGKRVKVMAWSPDSHSLAIGTIDGTVEVWRGDAGPETYRGGSSLVNIAWSPDGKSIAAGGLDGSEWVWQVQ